MPAARITAVRITAAPIAFALPTAQGPLVLDMGTSAFMATELQLRARLGLTLVFISHDLSVVRVLCDDVAILHRGEVVEYGPVARIFSAPRDEYTRQLLSAIPLPDVEPGWLDDSSPFVPPQQQGSAA